MQALIIFYNFPPGRLMRENKTEQAAPTRVQNFLSVCFLLIIVLYASHNFCIQDKSNISRSLSSTKEEQ